MKQNVLAILVLLATAVALWKLWPATPAPKFVTQAPTTRRAPLATTLPDEPLPTTEPTTAKAPPPPLKHAQVAATEPAAVVAGANSEGHVETINGTRVIGWAWDKDQPDLPIAVEISDGVNPPVLKTAAKFRDDLKKAGIGDGRHCFVYDFGGKWKPGITYTVHVKIAGADAEIKGSPIKSTAR